MVWSISLALLVDIARRLSISIVLASTSLFSDWTSLSSVFAVSSAMAKVACLAESELRRSEIT